MIQPWARKAWELDRDPKALASLITAAYSLASRFNEKIGSLRSWDICKTRRYNYEDLDKDFLVIIDNMLSTFVLGGVDSCCCMEPFHFLPAQRRLTDQRTLPDLDLLFWVSRETSDPRLAEIATSHALTSMRHHVRDDSSTVHVVNFSPSTYEPKEYITNQGYSDTSCWARGQAWAVLGFTQTYLWTKRPEFLDTAKRCATYFLDHLPEDGVPYWDFDAPRPGPRDTSAAMILVYALLYLHEICSPLGETGWLDSALRLLDDVLRTSIGPKAAFAADRAVDLGGHDTILLHATINNYESAPRQFKDHGLVYADYFFLCVGNKLLDMGLVKGGESNQSAALSP